jgi:hypothetical protein
MVNDVPHLVRGKPCTLFVRSDGALTHVRFRAATNHMRFVAKPYTLRGIWRAQPDSNGRPADS